MKRLILRIFNDLKLLVLPIFLFSVVKCSILFSDLSHALKINSNYHQITLFVSDNFFTTATSEKIFLFPEFIHKLYSFNGIDRLDLYDKSTKDGLRNMYYLEKSLIILYTSNLSETKLFVDFLIPQLSVRERPKCLIVYCNFANYNENNVMNILKYAWQKKFLHFSIVELIYFNANNYRFSLIYYFNPFNEVVHKKEFRKDIEIFPEKLRNGFGYPLHIFKGLRVAKIIAHFIKFNRKDRFSYSPFQQIIKNQCICLHQNRLHQKS